MAKAADSVLVTGATGFIGKHLVKALLMRGEQVRAMGRDKEQLAHLAARGAEPLYADLRDRDATIAACAHAHTVYHVGAFSSAWGPRALFEAVNVEGTAAVLEGCRRHGVGRLVYVSSPSVVFDGTDQVNLPDDAPYPPRFVSIYSETKKRAEDLVHAARGEVPAVIIRPKAVFGPGDTSLLPRLIAAARANRLPQVGTGENRVDLTYVENVVHALLLAAHASDAVGKTYTITNGEPARPLWEVIHTVLRGLEVPTPLRSVPLQIVLAAAACMEARAILTRREPLLTRYSALILARTQTYDISRAQRELKYAPVVSLDEGIARTIRAFRHQTTAT